jgi:hypothetical protein
VRTLLRALRDALLAYLLLSLLARLSTPELQPFIYGLF